MIAIDTEEKLNWLIDGLENREIILDNRKRTEKEYDEIRREIAEYKVTHLKKNRVEEPLLV